MRLLILPLLLLVLLGFKDIPLEDDELEAQAAVLFEKIGCPVCGGQSLGGSSAELANDIRNVVRKRLAKGEEEQEIVEFLVDRYGEGIRLSPQVKFDTLFLWFLPALFFVVVLFFSYYRRR